MFTCGITSHASVCALGTTVASHAAASRGSVSFTRCLKSYSAVHAQVIATPSVSRNAYTTPNVNGQNATASDAIAYVVAVGSPPPSR